MKKTISIAFIFTSIIVLLSTGILISLPKTPPPAKTGAPGEGTCSDCHSGAGTDLGPGYVQLSFSGADNKYKKSKNYIITINVVDPDEIRFGFQTVSLDTSNNMAGTIKLLDTTNTKTQKDNATGRKYVNNYYGSSTGVWTYKWKSPPSYIGNITFYACGNATDSMDNTTGDNVYTTSMVITPNSLVKDEINEESGFMNTIPSITSYPNPVEGNFFSVQFVTINEAMAEIELFDINGKFIEPLFRGYKEPGTHCELIQLLKPVDAGIYFLKLKTGSSTAYKKIAIGF